MPDSLPNEPNLPATPVGRHRGPDQGAGGSAPRRDRIRAWRHDEAASPPAATTLPRGLRDRALRRERRLAGAPGYDLGRHIALARQAEISG
jgi:hypothetical protein